MMMIISRALAILAACLLVGASAGFGVAYAWQAALPHGAILACIAVAMALGLEIAKPFAIHGVFTSLKAYHFGRAGALLCVGLTALIFSLTAELTFQAMMRGDMTAERASAVTERQNTEGARVALTAKQKRLETALRALPAHRPAAVIEAAILAQGNTRITLWRQTNECRDTTKPASATWCAPILALRGELATAQEAARIEGELDTVRASLAAARADTPSDARSDIGGGLHTTVGAADPGAAALSVYATALGFALHADAISPWLPLIGVIALEIGATFAGVLLAAVWAFTDSPAHRAPHAPSMPVVVNPTPSPEPPIPLHAVNVPVKDAMKGSVKDKARKSGAKRAPHPSPMKALTHTPRALIHHWAGVCVAPSTRTARVTAGDAYQGFAAWCAREGHPVIARGTFHKTAAPVLRSIGGRWQRHGRAGVSYAGLRLLP